MNSILAQLYGTGGVEKTAAAADEPLDLYQMSAADLVQGLEDGSIVWDDGEEAEKTATEEGDLDLSQMSAADLIQGLEDGSIVWDDEEVEKTADPDLENMTARELIEYMEHLEAQESEDAEKVAFAKMAESGELDFFDRAGRIMAHAWVAELDKVAAANEEGGATTRPFVVADELPDALDIDIDKMSGAELVELLEQGYELEKDAGAREAFKAFWEGGKRVVREAGEALKGTAKKSSPPSGGGVKPRPPGPETGTELVHQPGKGSEKKMGFFKRVTGGGYRERGRQRAARAAELEAQAKNLEEAGQSPPKVQGLRAQAEALRASARGQKAMGIAIPVAEAAGAGAAVEGTRRLVKRHKERKRAASQ